ncbi:CG0192-related protein [Cellulomonas sp. P24]|uniref:CG0192-related protein n=1 Tax=Cellulomonas sp. P24 TaxID=2885206 RepID=UPI00216ACC24|nr:hypothetical protein [Cellulomonas sp. P24]MCR6491622.1 hypothetical protein [Cellulomonas sp. P24]
MALLHQAELTPSKIELLDGWAPSQPWYVGESGATLTSVGAFRFDDPAGEVGVETLLVRAGDGPVLQVPLTYRGAPLVGGEQWLIGTMQHSVLGPRWVYDGVGDPVYVQAVATAALTGGRQAELYLDVDGERVTREPTARVTGSGPADAPVPSQVPVEELTVRQEQDVTVVEAGDLSLVIARALGPDASGLDALVPAEATRRAVLSGTWVGRTAPVVLVLATVR